MSASSHPTAVLPRRPAASPFERAIMVQIDAIKSTVDILASAIESIELKLDEFIAHRSTRVLSALPALNRPDHWSAPASRHAAYNHSDKAGFMTINSEQEQFHGAQSEKLLMTALAEILEALPSQYERVGNVYEEIKLFVALMMNLVPDITPQGIITQGLLPYLRTSSDGSRSILDQIWSNMQTITGCNEEEIRRVFKRMIDTHFRGFRRKIMPLEQFPVSMLRLMNWLRTNVLMQAPESLPQMNAV